MSKRIFLADGRVHVVEMLQGKLEKLGYDVLATTVGKEIIRTLNVNNVPGLIVLEAGMAGMDMARVCRDIKGEKRTQHVPILLLKEKDVDEKPFREAGIAEFLTRPCDMSELIEKIERIVRYGNSQAVAQKTGLPISRIIMSLIVLACVVILIFFIFVPLFSSH